MTPKNIIIILLIIVLGGGGYYYFYMRGDDAPEPAQEAAVEEVVEEAIEVPEAISAPADVAAIPADAVVNEAGIGIRIIQEGDGENYPTLDDDITIHYTGWTTDGEMFDSSRLRGEPSTFPLGRLIEGWKLSVPSLSKGTRALIWIPGDLGYDLRLDRPDAPKGMLVFDIELFDFVPSTPEQE